MRCAALAVLAASGILAAGHAAAPPPMAAVGLLAVPGGGACSGTLIAPDLVLTAAHCLLDAEIASGPQSVAFRTGAYPGHPARAVTARDVTLHPFYLDETQSEMQRLRHDAALVLLAEAVPADIATPMPVAQPGPRGQPTFVASYRGGRPERARERRCPILSHWRQLVTLSCDVRPGESGSPVLSAAKNGLRVVGIVSASSQARRTELALAVEVADLVGPMRAILGHRQSP